MEVEYRDYPPYMNMTIERLWKSGWNANHPHLNGLLLRTIIQVEMQKTYYAVRQTFPLPTLRQHVHQQRTGIIEADQ